MSAGGIGFTISRLNFTANATLLILEGHAQFIGRVSSNNIRRDSLRHLTIGDASWSNGFVLMAREKR